VNIFRPTGGMKGPFLDETSRMWR